MDIEHARYLLNSDGEARLEFVSGYLGIREKSGNVSYILDENNDFLPVSSGQVAGLKWENDFRLFVT